MYLELNHLTRVAQQDGRSRRDELRPTDHCGIYKFCFLVIFPATY